MKKFITVFTVLFSLVTGVFAGESTFTFDYGMPLLFWNNNDYDFVQSGYEFMTDYRFMGEDLGLQFTLGIGQPMSITKSSRSSDYSVTSKTNTSSKEWFVIDSFFGLSFRTMQTDLVELYITPGIGLTYDMVTTSSSDKTNLSFGAGIDISSNVIIGDGVGITAGILTQYQMYQIERDYGSSMEYRNTVSNLYFIPRAGIYITF